MTIKSLHYVMASLIALSAVVFSVAAAQQTQQSKDEQELTALVKQITEAQSKFDPATLDKIYTSDFIEISPIGEVDPRDKTIGFYKPEAKPPGDKMNVAVTTDEFLIRTYGNFAVVIVRIGYAPVGAERQDVHLSVSERCSCVVKKKACGKLVQRSTQELDRRGRRPLTREVVSRKDLMSTW